MVYDMKKEIYEAQCIGNVEPIEYMIPYPSMRSLIEGQNIKYANQIIIEDPSITNYDFYVLVQKTAAWLTNLGLKPKTRVIINANDPLLKTLLLFGIWQIGCTAIISGTANPNKIKEETKTKFEVSIDENIFEEISMLDKNFTPKYKPLLSDEALILYKDTTGIKLSHYNLLVNVNSIKKMLKYPSQSRISIRIPSDSIGWVILGSILPIYSGYIIDNKNPDFTIGLNKCDFNIRFDLKNIPNFSKNDIGICEENSGCISFGSQPIHLTSFLLNKNKIKISGHSVMMGYLDNTKNQNSFFDKSLNIKI